MDETSFSARLCRGCASMIPVEPPQTRCPTCGLGVDEDPSQNAWGVPVPDGYQILAKVGQGGMGAVYKAKDLRLDRVVALKYLTVSNKDLMKRFVREGQILARLVHSGIIRVFGYEVLEESPLLICEFVEGESLADVLQREGKLLPARALKLMCDHVLPALKVAHEMNVVHRDLKLENLLVTDGEVVKLADFGVASCRDVTSGGTGSGIIVGTPAYMAPEQAMGGKVDGRADLYSVGCMLFELLTGRLPFEDPNPIKVLEMQVKKQPILINRLDPSIGVELTALVSRCLEKDPDRRHADADELIQAMRDPELVRTARRNTTRVRLPDSGRAAAKSAALVTSDSMMAIPIPVRAELSEPVMPQTGSRWKVGAAAVLGGLALLLAGLFAQNVTGVTPVTLHVEGGRTLWDGAQVVYRLPATPAVPGVFLARFGPAEETEFPARPHEGHLVAVMPIRLWSGCTLRFRPDESKVEVTPASFDYAGVRAQILEEVQRLHVKAGMLTDPASLAASTGPRRPPPTARRAEWYLRNLRRQLVDGTVSKERFDAMMNLKPEAGTPAEVESALRYLWNQILNTAPLAVRFAPAFILDPSLSAEERQLMLDTHHLTRLVARLVDMHELLENPYFRDLRNLVQPAELPDGEPTMIYEASRDRKLFFPEQAEGQLINTIGTVADIQGAEYGDELLPELRLELTAKGPGLSGTPGAAALVIRTYAPGLQNFAMKSADLLWITLNGKKQRTFMQDRSAVGKSDLMIIPIDPELVSESRFSVHLVREAVGDWETAEIRNAPIEQFLPIQWVQLRVWTKIAEPE